MSRQSSRISDEAVRRSTGRTWAEWERWLDDRGAAAGSHREIVALLRDGAAVESAWWQQAVTAGYEKAKGRRRTGETEDAGFQVGFRRTVPIPHERVWRLLTSPEGVRAWLGETEELRFEQGQPYRLADGCVGEIRVVRENRHLRLTRKPQGWQRASTLQVRTTPSGDKTVLAFHEEHLPGAAEREARRKHFEAAVAGVLELARR